MRVFTFTDLERWMKPLPLFGAVPPGLAAVVKFDIRQAPQWALCRDRARHVGEIVAMVVADSPERAEDAVELIEVEWELLPPVVDMTRAARARRAAPAPGVGQQRRRSASRIASATPTARSRGRDVTVTRDLPHPALRRHAAREPRRGRGVGPSRRDDDDLERTQVSHFVQQGLTGALGLPPHKIRVIAPDLGGGFGTKASGYAEDALIPIAAVALGRPVKWIESRREHMIRRRARAPSGRTRSRLAATRDGTILGVRDRIWLDLGAYNVWGVVLPVQHGRAPDRARTGSSTCGSTCRRS